MKEDNNYLMIETGDKGIEIRTNGDMMKVVPQIVVYALNYIEMDDLAELINILKVDEFTAEEIIRRYPFRKGVDFMVMQNNTTKFRIYSKNLNKKDLITLVLMSLVLLSKENRMFLYETVLFPLYKDAEFLKLDDKAKIKWMAEVISSTKG